MGFLVHFLLFGDIMKIGNIEIKNNFILAPMAGYTDAPFRTLCCEAGAGLVCTEMVSARGLLFKSENTFELLSKQNTEPTAVQLFSNEPEIMADCVQLPELNGFCLIDINMGCPVPKIVKNGMGSALSRDLRLASKVIESAVLHTTKPITVKFRLGWDDDNKNYIDFAKMCEDSGASAICVHGRTREQMYAGVADWKAISQVKHEVKIPVFGNGDILTTQDVYNAIKTYNVDGVAIARGALGNPWIFAELSHTQFEQDRLKVIKRHYNMMLNIYPQDKVVPLMRKHLSYYLKRAGIGRNIRASLNIENDYLKVMEMLEYAFTK